MAIDTRSKRCSVIALVGPAYCTLPLTDATIDASDREGLAYAYAGLAAAGVGTGPPRSGLPLLGAGG